MWHQLGKAILKYKVYFLSFLFIATIFMGYFAAQVKLSYEFTKAIPEDNPKFVIYKKFVKKFGVDGTTIVIGFQTDKLYTTPVFNKLFELHHQIKNIPGVTDVLSIPFAYNLTKDTISTRFLAQKVFHAPYTSDSALIADQMLFEQLPFYKNLLYNPSTHAYMMAISFMPDSINSASRSHLIKQLEVQ